MLPVLSFIIYAIIRDPIRPVFPGTVPVLWVLQSSVLVSHKFSLGHRMTWVFSSYKNKNISDNANRHFDFPTVGILPDLAAGNTGSKACAR
jgi:hypothetical protein